MAQLSDGRWPAASAVEQGRDRTFPGWSAVEWPSESASMPVAAPVRDLIGS